MTMSAAVCPSGGEADPTLMALPSTRDKGCEDETYLLFV